MFILVRLIVLFINVAGLVQLRMSDEKYPGLNKCLLKIAEDEVKSKKFVFLLEEVENNDFPSIMTMNWHRVIVPSVNVSTVSGIFVFLPDSNISFSYEKLFKIKYLDYDSVYIICTDNFYLIYTFFSVAWSFKIIDVIALYPSKITNRISVYTYFPFGSWGCSTTDPVAINIYNISMDTFQNREKIFSKKEKMYNLHKCPIRVTINDKHADFVHSYNRIDKLETVTMMFHLLLVRMNFTPEIISVDKESNTYAAAYYNFTSAAILRIVKGESDIAVGRFTQLIDHHIDTMAPAQTSMDCFTWAVPIEAGKKPSVWTTSLYEFDLVMWILIILCFILCALIFHLISMYLSSYNISTLTLFGMLLNISVNMKFSSNTVRVFIAHWILFCLVIMAAYSASLGSLVTVPPYSSDIKSTSELLEKEIQLWGDPKMYHILSASSETSSDIRRALEKFSILRPGEFDKILYDIYFYRNKAVFYTKNKLIQGEHKILLEKDMKDLIHIIPDCLIRSHTAPLMLRKGSLLMDPVKEIITRIQESGIIDYWFRIENYANRPRTEENKAQKFTLSQLRGAIIVIISGYIISTVAFLYEIFYDRMKVQTLNVNKKSERNDYWQRMLIYYKK